MVTIIPKKGTQRRTLFDFILRADKPVTMADIKQAVQKGKIKTNKMMKFNVGPLMYSMCKGYKVCTTEPLLKVVKIEGKTKQVNAFVLMDYITEEFMIEHDKEIEKQVFEQKRSKANAIKVLKEDGDIVVTASDGKEILIGRRDKDGNTKSITPYRCCWCQSVYPDVDKAHYVMGVGWFCDECMEDYKNENSSNR